MSMRGVAVVCGAIAAVALVSGCSTTTPEPSPSPARVGIPPVNGQGETDVPITVQEGWSSRDIADELEHQGLLPGTYDRGSFLACAAAKMVVPGDYVIPYLPYGPDQLCDLIFAGSAEAQASASAEAAEASAAARQAVLQSLLDAEQAIYDDYAAGTLAQAGGAPRLDGPFAVALGGPGNLFTIDALGGSYSGPPGLRSAFDGFDMTKLAADPAGLKYLVVILTEQGEEGGHYVDSLGRDTGITTHDTVTSVVVIDVPARTVTSPVVVATTGAPLEIEADPLAPDQSGAPAWTQAADYVNGLIP
jgi:hypothetical protein